MTIQEFTTNQDTKKSQLKMKEMHRTVHKLDHNMFGQDIEFKISKNVEKLAQDWLIFEITSEVLNYDINTLYLAACLMSSITLQNSSGIILDCLRPERIIHKLESMRNVSGLYQTVIKSIEPPIEFTKATTSGSCTLKLPLMFFYSFAWSEYLDIRETEDLFIRCRVNTPQGMNIVKADLSPVSLTGMTVSLIQEYYTKNRTYANLIESGPAEHKIARTLKKTATAWFDKTVTLRAGSSSYEYPLKCNLQTNNLIAIIFAKATIYRIDSFKLSLNGTYVVGSEYQSITTDLNYNFSNQMVGTQEVKYLEYYFDPTSSNVVDSKEFITFSKESNMSPAYLTLYYETLPNDAQLYIFNDVPTSFSVQQDRTITINKNTVPDDFILNDGNLSRSRA